MDLFKINAWFDARIR